MWRQQQQRAQADPGEESEQSWPSTGDGHTDQVELMQRSTQNYRAHSPAEARRAMAEARRCMLRVLDVVAPGEAQAYAQQALVALQPEAASQPAQTPHRPMHTTRQHTYCT